MSVYTGLSGPIPSTSAILTGGTTTTIINGGKSGTSITSNTATTATAATVVTTTTSTTSSSTLGDLSSNPTTNIESDTDTDSNSDSDSDCVCNSDFVTDSHSESESNSDCDSNSNSVVDSALAPTSTSTINGTTIAVAVTTIDTAAIATTTATTTIVTTTSSNSGSSSNNTRSTTAAVTTVTSTITLTTSVTTGTTTTSTTTINTTTVAAVATSATAKATVTAAETAKTTANAPTTAAATVAAAATSTKPNTTTNPLVALTIAGNTTTATGTTGTTGTPSAAGTATATATSTTTAPAVGTSPEAAPGWIEFCERHARASASDFAKAFCTYVSLNLSDSARSSLSHRDFLKKFVESFCQHFEREYLRRTVRSPSLYDTRHITANDRELNIISQNNNVPIRTSSHEEFSDYSEHDGEAISLKPALKHIFRRLSFKGLKKGKFFHKQQSDEVELSSHSEHRGDKHSKAKLSKIVVECRKEGIVNSLMGENIDGTQKWEKSRLALIKAIGGYMLEFYSPPKAVKPRSGVFCSAITEARETTALEMPDHENTFVLKTQNMEFVIEAHDSNDMRSWLATIKYCMRTVQRNSSTAGPVTSDAAVDSLSHDHALQVAGDGDRLRANSASKGSRVGVHDHGEESHVNPPELPPRLRTRSNSNLELCSSQQDIEQMAASEGETDLSSSLREYPWFHGTLPRSDAAQLVLHSAANGHGVFLVRQSETRKGEFVLTFNFQGRAKHLRMTLNDQGHCRVQHLCFPAIYDMLEHFRQNAIPLESGGSAGVTLTEYIVANPSRTGTGTGTGTGSGTGTYQSPPGTSQQQQQQQQSQERRPLPAPEPREVRTYGGSIRTRVESLERLEQQDSIAEQQGSTSSSTGRAIQNTYSFL